VCVYIYIYLTYMHIYIYICFDLSVEDDLDHCYTDTDVPNIAVGGQGPTTTVAE
jgi:hypothetical protein